MLNRRQFAAGAATLLAAPARAQSFPSKPVKILVPFAAGGNTDIIARLVGKQLSEMFREQFVVENRPGANGAIAAEAVAKAPKDGYTLFMAALPQIAIFPAMTKVNYDPVADFAPVSNVGFNPFVLAASSKLAPVKTLAEFVAHARNSKSNLSYGSGGVGSLGHLSMILLGKKGGFVVRHLPYRGGGPAVNDAVAGHIDMIIGSAALLAAQIEAGALRPLLQTGAQSLKNLGETQTAKEAGFADFEASAWWGIFATGGTPRPVRDRMLAELNATFRDPQVAKVLVDTQQINLLLQGPDEFGKFFAEQMNVWGAVVRDNDIKPD